jgi:hypothetical protein
MQMDEQRRMRMELERIYNQPCVERKQSQGIWQRLQNLWQQAIDFLCDDEPDLYYGDLDWWYFYGWQQGLHAPLFPDHDGEDAKAWLEKLYQLESNHSWFE